MGLLIIKKVEYFGDKYHFESPEFGPGLSIIEGPNGSGKSTFFNLIYYGLGGRVDEFDPTAKEIHEEIVGDSNNFVRLIIEINGNLFTLNRRFRDTTITVIKSQEELDGITPALEAETLPIFRREDVKTFSDWLLERLSIAVVDIFQGGRQFKLNFVDLARLIYHNQSPDPHGIYKPSDTASFVSDSLEIRRAIYQILVGKTLLELYEAFGNQKAAEKDVQAAKMVHHEYDDIVNQLLKASGITDVKNTKALSHQIEALEEQIASLLQTRRTYTRGQVGSDVAQQALRIEAGRIRALEIRQREMSDEQELLVKEINNLLDVERSLQADIQRINKVIYAHGQLNLFSRDTCPYCLNDVARIPDHCVCGNAVTEHDYQRFFYSSAEYLEILKRKTKTLETLRLAIKGVKDDAAVRSARDSRIQVVIEARRNRLDSAFSGPDKIDSAMEELDEKLLDAREKLSKSEEAFRLESKLKGLTKRLSDSKIALDRARATVNRLDGESKGELQVQISEFTRVYNEFMTAVVPECRYAEIDSETYLPLINGGLYREHSAMVPKRFLYYLTLMQLSLLRDIPFPRLLLIDTPETAGIDFDRLVAMIRQISALSNPKNLDYQILLSTGIGKYPPEFKNNVAFKLSDTSKLLQEVPQAAPLTGQ